MVLLLIITVLSFILIWLVFKLIYLDKNPFGMTRFWLIQIGAAGIWFIGGVNIEMVLVIPFVISFIFILIVFIIFNWKKNPFKMISFWVTQIIVAIGVMAAVFYIFLCALGGDDVYGNSLTNYIEYETITSITIIQRKDTVHIADVMPFLEKLQQVEQSFGPVKYSNIGKIVFTRTDGSKDSISTNGYGYGPYKGQWYQSEENVLEEYFKKK